MQNHLFFHMLGDVVRDFGQPVILWQVGVLLGTLALAYLLARLARRALDAQRETRYGALRFGAEALNRALFPLLGGVLVWIARAIAGQFIHTSLLDLALVPLFGIGLIYIVFYLARRVFGRDGNAHTWLSLVEKVVSLIVWVGMVLTVMGIQNDVLKWMASVQFRIANTHVTLLSLLSGLLWVCVTMIVAMWLGAALEDRLMRSGALDANLKVVLSRVGRALLILGAVLISLSLVGIDITVLGVFGGALGVGLGFGLQKIASNYVSGFIILIDRSLRIGDTINVSGLQGMVTQIRTRYTVVRGLDGIETLVPNEKLITDVVQNQSSYLTRGNAKATLQISYSTDVEKAMALLVEATQGVDRVLQDPAPTPYLAGFGPDGINLELGYWIQDAATGTSGVRSNVNRNIWRLFSEHGIAIPYAQREVRIVAGASDIMSQAVTMTGRAATESGSAA
ncbi:MULTISPECIES: mechanosensitive ion channel domain-containing protein [Paraburkholderia]|jgi:small-conductance mechanosensitive channel|uniref:mechanosensitive ion channel family protein n=1 Tax=Paraburkholderia TaxID=1822464 RepID=UPI001CAC02A8|nr:MULTISPECIES: mechanosensitive ion channel domain-containing protein [Paraburkholderia]BEU20484.1 mechanosensitive ion channel [Paraburkholderia sp. 22B1P]GJH03101.1 mechanosensitive ion channel [Paraburkholderia terrae]GJH37051.1 mechanosensitive ion channel [Paraburkholderia hospita]CAG9248616.1 Protein involved in stability of MscS mechanosensitive channel [Paraburkholderia caribensis]